MLHIRESELLNFTGFKESFGKEPIIATYNGDVCISHDKETSINSERSTSETSECPLLYMMNCGEQHEMSTRSRHIQPRSRCEHFMSSVFGNLVKIGAFPRKLGAGYIDERHISKTEPYKSLVSALSV